MIALAQYFARRRHRRPIYFAFVTGHFQLPQFTSPIVPPRPEVGSDATSVWMNDHQEIYHNAVAGLTVEHLGCRQWVDLAGRYSPPAGTTGASPTRRRRPRASARPTSSSRPGSTRCAPSTPPATRSVPTRPCSRPRSTSAKAPRSTPVVSGPSASCRCRPICCRPGHRERPGQLDLEKLDRNLAYAQVLAFARTIATLDGLPDAAF